MPGAHVRGAPARLGSLGRPRQAGGGTHAEAQLPGVATVVSFAFLEGQENGTRLSAGAQPFPGPSLASAGAGQPGHAGPASGAGRGEHGCSSTSRGGTPRQVRRAGEGAGSHSRLPPRAGPASPAPCSPGGRRSPPVPGGESTVTRGRTQPLRWGHVGPRAAARAPQEGPLPPRSRVTVPARLWHCGPPRPDLPSVLSLPSALHS